MEIGLPPSSTFRRAKESRIVMCSRVAVSTCGLMLSVSWHANNLLPHYDAQEAGNQNLRRAKNDLLSKNARISFFSF